MIEISYCPSTNDSKCATWKAPTSVIEESVFIEEVFSCDNFLNILTSSSVSLIGTVLFIFFLVVTPIGFIMRIIGKDVLKLKFSKDQSYWVEKVGPKSKVKNQF